jgi:glutathione peroxidase
MYKLILVITSLWLTSFYDLQVAAIDNNTIDFQSFQGKKILLVNIATNSPRISQLAGLQQLRQQYGDSLVIIGFPSNSFGNEPKSNSEIKQFCESQYGVSFQLAAKSSVRGESPYSAG